jgi:thiol-disulfide isomerase/thioredoxin
MRFRHRARWPRLAAAVVVLLGAAAGADTPAVRAITAEQFAAEMTGLRGRVVMLNVWATWCAPCLKEIPDLVTLEAELGNRGFVLVGLSVDEPEDAARVDGFRQKYFPGFRTLLRGSSDLDAVVSVVDPAWNEVVPTTYLIGRDGKTLSRIQGKKTLAQFREAALEALAAK